MGRPKKATSQDTRERILRAAEAEFGSHGFHRARLEDIASTAGIRRSSLLYYFGSKEKLYEEVIASVTRALHSVIGSGLASQKPPRERIEIVMQSLLQFAQQRRSSLAMFVRELLDNPPGAQDRMRAFINLVDALEHFFRTDGRDLVPEAAPVRSALVSIVTAQALRLAAGELGDLLWGETDDPRDLVLALMTQ